MTRIVKAPEERRSELVATAQQLFLRQGYEVTSISDIVQTVGVAQGTFYYYFDSKTAVLEAIVTEIVGQMQTIIENIVADETLSAAVKWQQVIRDANGWKIEKKWEMLEVSRLLEKEENALLKHKLRVEATKMMVDPFAAIIAQGVQEGVFVTPFVTDSAVIIVGIIATLGDRVGELLHQRAYYDDPVARAHRTVTAVQTAVERVLGAPAGSLPLIDEETLKAWFTD